jgi:hypothetical protein
MSLPLFDFAEYWAAGRLNAHGLNPYDPALVEQLQSELGRTAPGVLMWNPPWTLPLVMPFGLLDAHTAHLIWLGLQLIVLLVSADWLWRIYGGNPERHWIAWLVAFTFLPSYMALTAGQISPLLLLGAVLFLHAVRENRPVFAGFATLLLAIKPHLVLLFWVALLLWLIQQRKWSFLLSGIGVGVVATLIPLTTNPAVLGQYWHAITTHPPAQYQSPTLGTLLRFWFGEDHFALQFLPPLVGVIWLVIYWIRHRRNWQWEQQLPLLLLVSLLTAAYGAWPFDLVLMLVPVMHVAARPRWVIAAVVAHVAFNGIVLIEHLFDPGFFAFIWMTPAVLLGYLVLHCE